MAQIDPNIILGAVQQQRAGTSPFTNLQHIIQFQDLMEKRKSREAATKKQQTISDLIGSNIQQTPEGIALDQPSFIQQLSQIDPQAALEQQDTVRQQALEAQKVETQKAKALAEQEIAISKASKADLEKNKAVHDSIGSATGAILAANPEDKARVYNFQMDRLIDNPNTTGLISQWMDSGALPPNYTPEVDAILKTAQLNSLSAKEQLDIGIKEKQFESDRQKEVDKEVREIANKQFTQSSDLRKEFSKLSGKFVLQRDAFDRIQASASNPSAAGDLAMVFNFMKILDPGSTVRESEFATVARAAGLPERFIATMIKAKDGKILGASQRQDFVDRAGKLFGVAQKANNRLKKEFTTIANKNNLDPEQVILDFEPASNASAPQGDLKNVEDMSEAELDAEIKARSGQ